MTRTEIQTTDTATLEDRLRLNYSATREQEIEASNIRAELYRRQHQPSPAQMQSRLWVAAFTR